MDINTAGNLTRLDGLFKVLIETEQGEEYIEQLSDISCLISMIDDELEISDSESGADLAGDYDREQSWQDSYASMEKHLSIH